MTTRSQTDEQPDTQGDPDAVAATVRQVLANFGRLGVDPLDHSALADDADLYSAGLTSHASVTVMLGCEDAYDLEFPQEVLTKATFSSVASITAALLALGAGR